MDGSSASPLTTKALLTLLILFLLVPYSESIQCRQCYGNEACDICNGERCLKVISPGGNVRRECIIGNDPAFDFTGHKHTDEGEDAYICDDRDFCNSSTKTVFPVFLLTTAVLLKILMCSFS